MSKNASRHGAGLKTLAATGVDYEVHRAFLSHLWEQAVKGEVARLDNEWTNHYREGKGVAWVQGREYRMPMPSVVYVSRKFSIVC